MEIWNLFIVALMPVLKVLLLTAVGVFLAIERVLVFYVLGPALVGSSLAKFVTLRSLLKLWFMPLNVLITFIIGSVLGWLLVKITKAPRRMRGMIVGSCAAGNQGAIPLILIPAVCKEKGNPFGDSNVCNAHGLAYASLSMAICSIYLWSYVYHIVRIYSSEDSDEPGLDELPEEGAGSAGETAENLPKCSAGPLLPLKEPSLEEGHMENLELDGVVQQQNAKEPFPSNIKQGFQKVVRKLSLGRLFSPIIYGAIVGFIIGVVPPFQKAVIGDTAPLRVVEDSAYLLGESAIPTITLIMGANLLDGLKGSKVPIKVIIGIVAVRYIILPISGALIVKCAAVSACTMTQLFGAGQAECSVIMLYTYGLATISLTLWSAFFIWLVR
ncbi:transporter C5D [Salix suchowensis]|nr:transporter C5D [Salix suchowensis]